LEARQAPRTLASPATVTALLDSAGIRPSRSMGQNFLVDANILQIIIDAACISHLDTVIEVGAGLGALTQALLESSGRVYALESDDRLTGILEKELGYATNLVLIGADAARFDLNTLWEADPPDDVKMVSNLPYQIAATLIVDCLSRYDWIREFTVMVQREVAARLISEPGSREYSGASVKTQARAVVSRVANVSRNCFYPKPKVDSTILHLARRGSADSAGMLEPGTWERFDRVVSAAFSQRRKKLTNSMSSSEALGVTPGQVRLALLDIGRDPASRAEDLSVGEFAELARLLKN
jgi:16S rRNA (adenine1518-N6/adenine1519-N6)-dimethyltransferase